METVEIEIRTLDGSKTALSISPDATISNLKSRLKESFPPAAESPNFHLFFKGAKLVEDRRICGVSLQDGEFLVLIPYAKRIRRVEAKKNISESIVTPDMRTDFSDSTWRDILEDVSSLTDQSPSDPSTSSCIGSNNATQRISPSHIRRCHILEDIFNSEGDDALDPVIREKIRDTVHSASCLTDEVTDECFLFKMSQQNRDKMKRCACPSWLKRLLKLFCLVSTLYGIQQKHQKLIIWSDLEEMLRLHDAFGVEDVGLLDLERLSLICPKVVTLVKEESAFPKSRDAIIVFDVLTTLQKFQLELRRKKQMSCLSIVNAAARREYKFRSDIRNTIKILLDKAPQDSWFSLSDFVAMKQHMLEPKSNSRKTGPSCLESRCCSTISFQPIEMVEHLKTGFGSHGQIVHMKVMNARLPVFAEIPSDLSKTVKLALEGVGISNLYKHQADAIKASLSRKNVVVSTSTSSGKSLCYNLPVIEEMSQSSSSCALYLFPTKALAQDQLRSLLEMSEGLDLNLNIGIYDGDTPKENRAWLRDNARLLITNPDMLHVSILPFHKQFNQLLSNLRFIVIDEAHMYNGAFGCHTALILRRLRRICAHVYGSDPSFIFCSATSANPREHAMVLANLESIELFQNDGSPCASKYFLMWNPPVCSKNGLKTPYEKKYQKIMGEFARRSSPILETACLFAEIVQHGLRCIAFCKTRKLCELVLCYTREILQETASELIDSISSYRGGYTVEDRRHIETRLFNGELRGVAATNALELGIDVGSIDATLHLGFPGSIASLWQQAGRSGRRAKPSLAIYVAFEGPLDQYFMKFPQRLFGSQIECSQVDPHNQQLLEQHLACAALEHPLSVIHDEKFFGSGLNIAVPALVNKGYLCGDPRGNLPSKLFLNYIGPEKNPSHTIIIRAIETTRYKVMDMRTNVVIEEIEESKAFFQVYEGAVYMNQGITYLVKSLDLANKFAFCQKADLKYYTKTRDYTDVHVVGGDIAYPTLNYSQMKHMKTSAQVNKCTVTTCWFGFYRIWRGSNQIFDRVDLSLPTYSYDSQAVWIHIPLSTKIEVEADKHSFRAGQHAASHALVNLVPLYLMCNSSDLSSECVNPHETRDIPERILLYDQHRGGIGISCQVQHLFNELLVAALELVTTCSCLSDAGCPNCIQVLSCNEYNEVLDKKAAIMILKGVIAAERSKFADMSKENG